MCSVGLLSPQQANKLEQFEQQNRSDCFPTIISIHTCHDWRFHLLQPVDLFTIFGRSAQNMDIKTKTNDEV